MATDLKKIAEQLVGLTVLEVNELGNILKDEYGIEPAAAAVAVAAGPAAGGGDAPAADEKSEYDVKRRGSSKSSRHQSCKRHNWTWSRRS